MGNRKQHRNAALHAVGKEAAKNRAPNAKSRELIEQQRKLRLRRASHKVTCSASVDDENEPH